MICCCSHAGGAKVGVSLHVAPRLMFAAPAAYGSAAAATSCREPELCTGTLALEGCASVSGRHDRGDEGGRSGIWADQPGSEWE